MGTTKLLLSILASFAIALSSCSADDDPADAGVTRSDRQIRFGASTEIARGDITTNNLKTFNVYAYMGTATNPKVFMDNVVVTKNATNLWTYSPVEYWPAKESLDFFAFAPADWLGSATPVTPVPYDNTYASDDIVYAVSPNMSGNTGSPNAQVLFNFRHALSKVIIKLSSTNTNLQVKVTNVALANIAMKGNFHFPGISTSGNVTPNSIGHWTDQNSQGPYLYHMSQVAADVITLDSTPNDLSGSESGFGGAKYLIPQDLVWNNNGSGADNYLTVMCSVYDAHTGTKLWPNANTPTENVVEGSTYGDGLLKFPLSTASFNEWQPGYQYIYNVVINSNDEMGAIQFGDPAVDAFVDVDTNYQ
ncbi:MAG: fimbrillin family protein [Muribaculaceae bacterium]|nr:fimbrillin family protein [Muribaculaceae bacterium]